MLENKKRVDYAIILMESLKRGEAAPINVRTIAVENDLPFTFLEKVAQELKRVGWVESQKGHGGGYRISKIGRAITVADIINFFERPYEVCPVMRKIKKGFVTPI